MVVLALVFLMILALWQLYVAKKISKSSIIKSFVDALEVNNLKTFFPSFKEVKKIKKQFANQGEKYLGLTIRQAITFAINKKIKLTEPLEKFDMPQIDNMSGQEFESFLKFFFQQQGYKVTLTPLSGDQGVDLILEMEGKRIAVQAKRYNQNIRVGNSAIQEVAAGRIFYDCTDCWVITTSTFTKQAIELANKVGVKLTDRISLIRMLNN